MPTIQLSGHGFSLAIVFFGLHLGLLGLLRWRSKLLPRVFGTLVTLAGVADGLDGLCLVLAPALRPLLAPALGILASSELALAVWLVFEGLGPCTETSVSSPSPSM